MRNQLETEKREKEKVSARLNEVIEMLDNARKSYAALYRACERVVECRDAAGAANCPGWFNGLASEVFNAMADAELNSPFSPEGEAEPVADYCRTCGRPIDRTDASKAYCETCSRSAKVQTEEVPVSQPADTNA